jgi:FAD/FMN-containing dehydrogenase
VQVGLPVTAQAALIVEVDGYPASLDSQIAEITTSSLPTAAMTCASPRARRSARASGTGARVRRARSRGWRRHFYLVDVTVPRSTLAATLREIGAVLARYDLASGHVFHAGDGNLHPCILCDPKLRGRWRVFAATHEIVRRCASPKDGSITGEHGVGIEKRQHMPAMYSGAELAAMRDVKLAFDPDEVLNPGKVLPDDLPEPLRAAPSVERVANSLYASVAPHSAEEAAAILAGLHRGKAPREDRVATLSELPIAQLA